MIVYGISRGRYFCFGGESTGGFMKKNFIIFLTLSLCLSLTISQLAFAKQKQNHFKNYRSVSNRSNRHRIRAGKSNIGHLYLYQKNPDTWETVRGAWGKMKFNLSGTEFNFTFNGHGLKSEQNYTLIYYPDPWPGNGLQCLGSNIANEEGNVHIRGGLDTGNLPADYDENSCIGSDPDCLYGAKIWLVFDEDVDCENASMIGWRPIEYLFEQNLITFNKLDD